MDERFTVLQEGPGGQNGTYTQYNTLGQALADGAVVLAWGKFLNKVINFLGIGFTLYMVALIYSYTTDDTIVHPQAKCKFCKKYISARVSLVVLLQCRYKMLTLLKAKRCPMCTTWLDGREA
jgi:large conductance mechanosensitive channel